MKCTVTRAANKHLRRACWAAAASLMGACVPPSAPLEPATPPVTALAPPFASHASPLPQSIAPASSAAPAIDSAAPRAASSAREPWPFDLAPGYSPATPGLSAERPVWPTPVLDPDAGVATAAGPATAPQVRVSVEEIQVDGQLPAQQATLIALSVQGRLTACYQAALARDASIRKGSMVMRMVVGANGSVTKVARGATDLFDPKLMQCLMRANEALRFPSPAGGAATVGYRVVLSAQ